MSILAAGPERRDWIVDKLVDLMRRPDFDDIEVRLDLGPPEGPASIRWYTRGTPNPWGWKP